MDSDEFRQRAKQVVDYVAGYHDTIRQRRPLPDVEPGYLKALVPAAAPEDPDTWNDVIEDIERVIMPGVSGCHDTVHLGCTVCTHAHTHTHERPRRHTHAHAHTHCSYIYYYVMEYCYSCSYEQSGTTITNPTEGVVTQLGSLCRLLVFLTCVKCGRYCETFC